METAYTEKHLIQLVNKIKRLREKKNLTQTMLANMAGLDKQYIQKLEQYLLNPGYLNLYEIALALETTVDELARCSTEIETKTPTPIIINPLKLNNHANRRSLPN